MLNLRRKRELILERDGDRLRLRCPGVGLFTLAAPPGWLFSPGEPAGVIYSLEVAHQLVVPAGAIGRVVNERPPLVHQPVGYGDVLYELAPLAGDERLAEVSGPTAEAASGALVLAPHAGRFWHRASPDEPVFCAVGVELAEGHTIGLIEVMKTFTHLPYRPGGALPPKARIVRVLVDDGAEIAAEQPLLEIEPL
ncbi:MAG: hypothetical protein WD226_09940 [Planctomycetota bacterium]